MNKLKAIASLVSISAIAGSVSTSCTWHYLKPEYHVIPTKPEKIEIEGEITPGSNIDFGTFILLDPNGNYITTWEDAGTFEKIIDYIGSGVNGLKEEDIIITAPAAGSVDWSIKLVVPESGLDYNNNGIYNITLNWIPIGESSPASSTTYTLTINIDEPGHDPKLHISLTTNDVYLNEDTTLEISLDYVDSQNIPVRLKTINTVQIVDNDKLEFVKEDEGAGTITLKGKESGKGKIKLEVTDENDRTNETEIELNVIQSYKFEACKIYKRNCDWNGETNTLLIPDEFAITWEYVQFQIEDKGVKIPIEDTTYGIEKFVDGTGSEATGLTEDNFKFSNFKYLRCSPDGKTISPNTQGELTIWAEQSNNPNSKRYYHTLTVKFVDYYVGYDVTVPWVDTSLASWDESTKTLSVLNTVPKTSPIAKCQLIHYKTPIPFAQTTCELYSFSDGYENPTGLTETDFTVTGEEHSFYISTDKTKPVGSNGEVTLWYEYDDPIDADYGQSGIFTIKFVSSL